MTESRNRDIWYCTQAFSAWKNPPGGVSGQDGCGDNEPHQAGVLLREIPSTRRRGLPRQPTLGANRSSTLARAPPNSSVNYLIASLNRSPQRNCNLSIACSMPAWDPRRHDTPPRREQSKSHWGYRHHAKQLIFQPRPSPAYPSYDPFATWRRSPETDPPMNGTGR